MSPVVVYTIPEAAKLLKVSPQTVKRAIADGRLPVARFGRSVRISERALEEFVATNERRCD